jgi:hypothetical protein
MTVVVAIGLAATWAGLVLWLIAMWDANMTGGMSVNEQLIVDRGGRAYIHTAYYDPTLRREELRTIDGQAVTEDLVDLRSRALYPVVLSKLYEGVGPNWIRSWPWRLTYAGDFRQFPGSVTWFLVKQIDGRMFFEGYDDASRMRVGFIGRDGFRSTPPGRDEWFALSPRAPLYVQVDGHSLGSYGSEMFVGEDPEAVAPWRLYVLDARSVVEVDLRARETRTVLENAGAVSIKIGSRVQETPQGEGADQQNDAASGDPPFKVDELLILRLPDHVTLVDARTGEQTDFLLPEDVREAQELMIYGSIPGSRGAELIVQPSGYSSAARRVQLLRLDREGNILDDQSADLGGWIPKTTRRLAYECAVLGPVPAAWAVYVAGLQPASQVAQRPERSYGEAVRILVVKVWPGILIVAVAGIASALAVYRWQRSYRRSHTFEWCTAALFLGPMFAVAYLVGHRVDARASCESCGTIVPRAREACTACGEAFPAPALKGIEVFA